MLDADVIHFLSCATVLLVSTPFSLDQDGYCNYKNVTAMATMTGFVNVTSGDLYALKIAIAKHGPVSVAMDASHKSLSYANGVYYEPKCGKLSLRIFFKTTLSFGGFFSRETIFITGVFHLLLL